MGQKIIQVDAFTDKPYSGNPAAVCVMDQTADVEWMQRIALEMNLSETAFLYRDGDIFNLRWFTPTAEVDLCGHATLASSHVLWEENYLNSNETARFMTKSGELTVNKKGNWIEMNFPAVGSFDIPNPAGTIDALGAKPINCRKVDWVYLLEFDSADIVRSLKPNFSMLSAQKIPDVIVTGKDETGEYDFVSRFFAPSVGINEDPVTGFAHCVLTPYWAEKLNKNEFQALQASKRGGFLRLILDNKRVLLSGKAVTVMRGELV